MTRHCKNIVKVTSQVFSGYDTQLVTENKSLSLLVICGCNKVKYEAECYRIHKRRRSVTAAELCRKLILIQ